MNGLLCMRNIAFTFQMKALKKTINTNTSGDLAWNFTGLGYPGKNQKTVSGTMRFDNQLRFIKPGEG